MHFLELDIPKSVVLNFFRDASLKDNRRHMMSVVRSSLVRGVSARFLFSLASLILSTFFLSSTSFAAEDATPLSFVVGNLWIMLASILVFIMHLGFATLESGSVQKKNVANILFKNTAIIAVGILTYGLVGFNLMYPGESFAGGFFGFAGFGLDPGEGGLTTAYNENYTYWTDFIFQAMFAATCATIVSGAVAERIKLEAFFWFAALFVAVVYPMVGMWKWGGGFLDALATPFYDFAGSTIVHSVGGWAALAGAIILGPRLGKYSEGSIRSASPALATIGVFLLWFGWYGFNGGSVLSADAGAVSLVFVTTSMGASAGAIAAMTFDRIVSKHFNLMNALNGVLGGLVGITAGADQLSPLDAVIVGAVAGVLVVISLKALDKWKIDDPVGAISVHLTAGIWGTLAVGLFGSLASTAQLLSQVIGVVSVGVFTTVCAVALFFVIDRIIGLRVSEKAELEGLDYHEHALGEGVDYVVNPSPTGGK